MNPLQKPMSPFKASPNFGVLHPLFFALLSLVLGLLLASCGGGGSGGSAAPVSPAATTRVLDSHQNDVTESFPDGNNGGGDAAGADGDGGTGAPIPNAPVRLQDSAGRSVTATTNAQGYYRARIDGFVPPIVASVTRADGAVFYSPSVTPVKVRGFITINLTSLTDKLASDVAVAAGKSGAAQLTPALLAANLAALTTAKANLKTQLAAQISAAGLNAATFDPVTTVFNAVLTDPYDKLLESVVVTKDASGATVVTAKNTSLSGSCGSANNVAVSTKPTANLCTAGTASAVSGSGPWNWTCAGSNGGTTASCSAAVETSSADSFSTVGNYPITDCVKDNSTGLTWEGKPTGGFRASSNYYTNYDSTTALQNCSGSTCVAPTQSQIDAATNSIGYKNAVNASALCGYTDWRLPTLTELQSLVLTGVGSPTIDTTWFPNTQPWYMTSTPDSSFAGSAWFVGFVSGATTTGYRYNYDHDHHLRLMR